MSKFQGNDFNIQDDGTSKGPRVVKTSQPVERHVESFNMANLKQHAVQGAPKGKSEQRFMMSQLARDALSIEKEEQELINRRVSEKLAELSAKTQQEAFAQGHAEGLKKGHDEAFAEFQAESAKRLEHLDSLIQAMESAKNELFESNREFLMNVIYRVAKTVVLKEVSTDREYLVRLSRELIERSGLRDNLTLKLNPSDAESLEMLKQGMLQSFSNLRNLTIELSDHVSGGGCVLETEWGAIDASLETQLSQVLGSIEAAKGTTP